MRFGLPAFAVLACLLSSAVFSGCDQTNNINDTFTFVTSDVAAGDYVSADTSIVLDYSVDTNRYYLEQKTSPAKIETAKVTKFILTSPDSSLPLTNFSSVRVTISGENQMPVEIASTSIPDTVFLRYALPIENNDIVSILRTGHYRYQVDLQPKATAIPQSLGFETGISLTAHPN